MATAFDRLARLCRPTIAAIQGHAFGGGLDRGHLRHPRGWRRWQRWACRRQVGIVPGWSGTQRLTRLLPEPVVKEGPSADGSRLHAPMPWACRGSRR
ncbi:MAG: hypothetical protein R3D03_01260 [Geminicoccaceae bacterium]